MKRQKVGVIGDGGWGTALAIVLVHNGHDVTLWGPFEDYIAHMEKLRENESYLSGVAFPQALKLTADAQEVANMDALVLASPSKFYRSVLERIAPYIQVGTRMVSVSKGFDAKSGSRLSACAEDLLGCPGGVSVLSGPSHAEEVARGIPSAVTIASQHEKDGQYFQELFSNPYFRLYTSQDKVGVELGGSLKNVMAVAAGISDGIGYGDNTKSAMITRGLHEITRIGARLGADPKTFYGLSGMGDLMVTCFSRHSRNRGLGERLGKGEKLDDILAGMKMVAEGVETCVSAVKLAKELDVEMPIIQETHAVLFEQKDPTQAVQDLLDRPMRPEH